MWLVFALVAPFFFAIVHVMDSHCVDEIFEKPWLGVFTSAFASLVVYLAIPFAAPFFTWQFPGILTIAMALGSGFLIQVSQGLYFKAQSYSEAGIIAAYWNMIPIFIPIMSFIIFRESLYFFQYIGISLLIVSSVLLCIIDTNLEARWKSFHLMIGACFLQAVAYLLEDELFEITNFFLGFLLITTGIIITGFLPLVVKRARSTIRRNFKRLTASLHIFILIEIFNLIALASAQAAIDLGNPPLVAAIETTLPAYTIMLSLVFLFVYARFGDFKAWQNLPAKLALIGTMIFGVWLVS